MSETLKTFALMLGAISGWEFVKWLDARAKAGKGATGRCKECGAVKGMKHMSDCPEARVISGL